MSSRQKALTLPAIAVALSSVTLFAGPVSQMLIDLYGLEIGIEPLQVTP